MVGQAFAEGITLWLACQKIKNLLQKRQTGMPACPLEIKKAGRSVPPNEWIFQKSLIVIMDRRCPKRKIRRVRFIIGHMWSGENWKIWRSIYEMDSTITLRLDFLDSLWQSKKFSTSSKLIKTLFIFLLALFFVLTLQSCRTKPNVNHRRITEDSIHIVHEILSHRAEVDSFFRYDPDSPFNNDTSIHFEGIKWFPIDVNYFFQSKLYRYNTPETVSVFGTKGEERRELKYGYFVLNFEGQNYKLNVYKFTPYDRAYASHKNLLSVWFTDETTGKETYEVGRYVEVGNEQPDTGHYYIINFNNAYNPYCAYSSMYSCAIPRKEDHLNLPVHAGEMKYHH